MSPSSPLKNETASDTALSTLFSLAGFALGTKFVFAKSTTGETSTSPAPCLAAG